MPAWTLHLINARGQLAAGADIIGLACADAERRLAAVTPPLALDIIVSAAPNLLDGLLVGGNCYEPGVIGLRIDLAQPDARDRLYGEILKTLFHEFHHALRWEGPGYGHTLGEALVSEGLAQRFLHEMMDCPPEPWEDAVSPEGCEAWRTAARAAFNDPHYDHGAWFFGEGEMPRWLGYALGKRIVDSFCERHPEATALGLVSVEAGVFGLTYDCSRSSERD